MKEFHMKVPGPDHPITIEPSPKRVRVSYNNHVVADSRRALILKEADLPPVIYFPREDADMPHLTETSHHTHSPYMGEASYYTLKIGNGIEENAAWSYETPYPAMERIRGHIAFHESRVDSIDVLDDPAEG